MGSNKSSRIIKSFLGKKKSKEPKDSDVENRTQDKKEDDAPEQTTEEETTDDNRAKKGKKSKKSNKKKGPSPQQVMFSNRSISNLSRALGCNDWIRLAFALGFLPQAIAHFTGRASSSQNSYSQCTMMLKTWRNQTAPDEILPRLSDALQKIRRHDLAVKISLELAIRATDCNENTDPSQFPELLNLLSEDSGSTSTALNQSEIAFMDNNVSFLARQLLAREEWKRLAYALEFLPDEVSQIIASASSSQNLYAQAHKMLIKFRERTPPSDIIGKLRAAFTRIRRHDLVFLLDLGVITSSESSTSETTEEKLKRLHVQTKRPKKNWGEDIIEKKFPELQTLTN